MAELNPRMRFPRVPFCLLVLLLVGCSGSRVQPPWEIQLVPGKDCGSCSLFEEMREDRGIGDALRPDSKHFPGRVPIRVLEPEELTADDFRAMGRLPYLSESETRELLAEGSLLVIVRNEGRIAAAGNIAWSTNLPRARFPASVMNSPVAPPFAEMVESPSAYYRDYFIANWSLEHFLELARNPSRAHPREFAEAYSPSPGADSLELHDANAVILGSASTPAGNPLFIPERIREIRSTLTDPGSVPENRIHVYFGDGGGTTNDTSVEKDGELAFRAVNLGGERSLDAQALVDLFTALERQSTRRNLFVQVGHGVPWGMPVWGHLAVLDDRELRKLHDGTGADNVLVSGACFGGIFARSTSCGFFAARPDVVAAGCQRSPDAVARSDDYPRWYFRALEPAYTNQADANGDGKVSFREAHWFAATRLEHDQIPYTTLDALADAHFDGHPDSLPESVSRDELRQLAGDAPTVERTALDRLLRKADSTTSIRLRDPAGQKRAVRDDLDDLADAGSAERNRAMDLPYPLALVQLARRLVYREANRDRPPESTTRVDACESRSIIDFLR